MTLRDIIAFVKATAELELDGEIPVSEPDDGMPFEWSLDYENEQLTFIIERCRELCTQNSIKFDKPKPGDQL